MTVVSDEEYYEQHAALLGRVTLAWNDCHYMVLCILYTLSGDFWTKACAAYFEQPSDHNRRGIVLTRMKEVLTASNDAPMLEKGKELLEKLGNLAIERNLATHTMWMWVMPQREIRPHPALPQPANLEDDFKAQFSNLTTGLRALLRELMLYESGLRVHLVETRY